MIGRLVLLGGLAGGAAVAADRWLAERSDSSGRPAPIRSMVVVDAPIDRVWAVLSDIERQPTWMHDMKSVRLLTPPPHGLGTRGEATVRVLGIAVTDPVTVTEWQPPRRFGVRHEGAFTGAGAFTLEPGADGTTTIVRWEEMLVAPMLPRLANSVLHLVFGPIFQADLHRLRRILEEAG